MANLSADLSVELFPRADSWPKGRPVMQRDIVMDIGSGLTLTLHPEEARELHERLAEWCQTACPCYQRGQNEEES